MASPMSTMKKASNDSKGSPAQYAQPSRKGKKAWRKNIDIVDVEEGLEEMRAEEREAGSTLKSKANDELFQLDATGDDKVRKTLPKFDKSQLSYNKSLLQRSAVPSVFSRSLDSAQKKRSSVSYEEKARLLRIAKRKRFGPFDSIVDNTQLGEGSALLEPSHAVQESGTYDMWSSARSPKAKAEVDGNFSPPTQSPAPKAPKTLGDLRAQIALPAVVAPPEGASYNPPAAAHQTLLRSAHELAEKDEAARARKAAVKTRMENALKVQAAETHPGVPIGMTVDELAEAELVVDAVENEAPAKRQPARKTKQQRQRALKLKAEKREAAERAAKKHLLASLSLVKRTRREVRRTLLAQKEARAQRQKVQIDKLRTGGLAGRRIGKHVVREEEPIVQLGDDLSESLRGLKVEGNLFKDRFLSLQHRALLEPRAPVLPRKHRSKTKEVEKFAWKRFE